jgi:hypothetical protein
MEEKEEETNKGDKNKEFSLKDYLEISGMYLKKVAVEGYKKLIGFFQNALKDDNDEQR